MTAREKAEMLLKTLKGLRVGLLSLQSRAEEEIARIRAGYGPTMEAHREDIERCEKELKALAKGTKSELFDGADQVTLENGVLLYTSGVKVRIPRDALERIEAEGWLEAIRIAKSVNRPVVEKWPEEKLAVIGADRKQVESFSYELK